MTRIGEYVRGTRSLVFVIGAGGIKYGGGKSGWRSVGVFGVLGDGRGSGISSAVTEKSCSQFGSKNAIGAPLGWVQSDSQGITKRILNAPSASVVASYAIRGCSRISSSLEFTSASVKSKWGRTETRTARFESTPAQKGWRRVSRLACHRWICKPSVLENEGLRCGRGVEEFSREGEGGTDEKIDSGLGKPCDRDDAERDIGGVLRSAAIVSGDWCNACSSSSSRRTVFVSRSSSELVKGSASGGRLPWGSP